MLPAIKVSIGETTDSAELLSTVRLDNRNDGDIAVGTSTLFRGGNCVDSQDSGSGWTLAAAEARRNEAILRIHQT